MSKQKVVFKTIKLPQAADGKPRDIIIALVITTSQEKVYGQKSERLISKNKVSIVNIVTEELVKVQTLSVGISITNPVDEYDEEYGKKIAEGRALKESASIMNLQSKGITFNSIFIKNLLVTVEEMILNAPNKYVVLSPVKPVSKLDALKVEFIPLDSKI